MKKINLKYIVSLFAISLFMFLAIGTGDETESSDSNSCTDIVGNYSGNVKIGYVNGSASLKIKDSCKFTFTQKVNGSSSSQYGKVSKSGSSYKFIFDDNSNYDVSVSGSNITISGNSWKANLSK